MNHLERLDFVTSVTDGFSAGLNDIAGTCAFCGQDAYEVLAKVFGANFSEAQIRHATIHEHELLAGAVIAELELPNASVAAVQSALERGLRQWSGAGPICRLKYGPFDAQEGDLHLPLVSRPPVVCLLHGGFWRMPHGRDALTAVAKDLTARGFAVWNIEYRRLGAPGGGWPGTLSDVAAAVDHLATLATDGMELDLARVITVGHSAGGHLALWVASQDKPAHFAAAVRVRPIAAAGLAPVVDLARAWELGVGRDAVNELIGAGPEQYPDRYAAASPRQLLPLGVRQLVIHGTMDDALPIELSREYAAAAEASGDDVAFVELPGAGHMEYLDPDSKAHAHLCEWLMRVSADRVAATG